MILDTFEEGKTVLSILCDKTQIMFPNSPDLMEQNPKPSEVDIVKLHDLYSDRYMLSGLGTRTTCS